LLLGIEGLREASESRGATFSDRLVAQVAHAAQRSLRQIDVLCRYGPGELAALLPSTHFAGSLVCADRLARELPSSGLDGFVPRVSMGLSFCPGKDVAEPADLLRIASRALDRARAEGPGNICLYQHQGYLYLPKLT
jgi:diguanylate cyclase (GGDEF)-like protein